MSLAEIGEAVTPIEKQPATWGKIKGTALFQNYPNPFNPETWIPYQLREETYALIKIYDSSGQLICTLELGYKQPGFYIDKSNAAHWDGMNNKGEKCAGGIYFYQLVAGDFTEIRKMAIVE